MKEPQILVPPRKNSNSEHDQENHPKVISKILL